MFKKATKLKLRFASSRGSLSTEDLYDLPLKELDAVAIACQKEAENEQVSFICEVTSKNEIPKLRFEIVKEIITDRLAVAKAAEHAQANAQKKQQLLAILANKQNEEMAQMSTEDIQKLIADL